MFGYYINTDYPLLKESASGYNGKKVISCYQDERILHWKQNESTVFIGTNKYNTISVYQCLGGKLVTVKDMGEFFIYGNQILYYISSKCFSEEAICTTISTHIMGNIMLEDSYLLHATTLLNNGHALCILGSSGAGKSTFSLKLMIDCGYTMISDDMTSITNKNHSYCVTPGNTYIKLWSDTYNHFGDSNMLKNLEVKKVYKNEDKFIISLPKNKETKQELPLNAIVVLCREKEAFCTLRRINTMDSFAFLYGNNYIGYACTKRERLIQTKLLSGIVSKVPIYLLSYPSGYEHLEDAARCVEKLMI